MWFCQAFKSCIHIFLSLRRNAFMPIMAVKRFAPSFRLKLINDVNCYCFTNITTPLQNQKHKWKIKLSWDPTPLYLFFKIMILKPSCTTFCFIAVLQFSSLPGEIWRSAEGLRWFFLNHSLNLIHNYIFSQILSCGVSLCPWRVKTCDEVELSIYQWLWLMFMCIQIIL